MKTMSKTQMIRDLTAICEDYEQVTATYEEVMNNQRETIDDLHADTDSYEFRIKQLQETSNRQSDRIRDLIRERDEDRVDYQQEIDKIEAELRLARDVISEWVAQDESLDRRDEAIMRAWNELEAISGPHKLAGDFTLADTMRALTILRGAFHDVRRIDEAS